MLKLTILVGRYDYLAFYKQKVSSRFTFVNKNLVWFHRIGTHKVHNQ